MHKGAASFVSYNVQYSRSAWLSYAHVNSCKLELGLWSARLQKFR